MKLLMLISLLLFTGCSGVFYQPSKRLFIDPAQYKVPHENINFSSRDGTALHGWFFPAVKEGIKGTIVHFHGNAQNISTHFLNLLWLTQHGYNIFTFDYRGYGKSEGDPDQEGVYLDALSALDKGLELGQGKGLFVVYGQSLGGIVSLRALADYPKLETVDLIVQDSTFSSYKDIAFDKLASRWFLLPFSPLAWLLISDQYASDEVFQKIHQPTLVITGEKDAVIPMKFGKTIYKEISADKKWFWKVPDGQHIDVFHHSEGEHYRQEFLQLLDQLGHK